MNVSSSGVSVPKGSTEDACDRDAAYRESIARLYREHNQALLKFLRLRVDSDQEAQEVAQEAYVRMLQLESTRAVSFLSSYLFRIAVNIAIDRHRRKSLAFRSSQEAAEHQTFIDVGSDVIAQAREELSLIGRFIEELPPKCREAFYLHRLDELSPAEIATRLQVTPRMVHHYLVRALVHVRSRLDDVSKVHAQEQQS
jgi:RNA polymerase sigma-70 factor (ECF subfamily)